MSIMKIKSVYYQCNFNIQLPST